MDSGKGKSAPASTSRAAGKRKASVQSDEDSAAGRLSSVACALRLLKTFSEDEVEIGISGLAKRLDVAKSTVHRLVTTLVSEGFLEQNPDSGRYRLGLSLFALGALMRNSMNVSNQARSLLLTLRDRIDEAVHLAVLEQNSIMYLYNLESRKAIGIRSHIGARKPAFCTSEGRVMLAFAAPEVLDRVFQQGLVARTPATVTDPKKLRKILADVREEGYAIDDEESEIGLRAIAAPIRDVSGQVVAAVGLAAPAARLTKRGMRALIPELVQTASTISARLGHRTA
jgi:IclR family KDG regulon transcriptional repressor